MTEHPTLAPNDADETPVAAPIFNADVPHATPERPLSEAARRALQEAADRRAAETLPILGKSGVDSSNHCRRDSEIASAKGKGQFSFQNTFSRAPEVRAILIPSIETV